MEGIIFQTSLVASFVAGIVALFAPCCITFLLPAYLGSVFKEKEKIILMTLVFGLGIFVVLLPAVLGVALISQAIFRYHDTVYLIGGIIMLAVSVVSFLGIKLPMPRLKNTASGKTDVLSIFTLGIFSGLTSACCAPVLIGILTMTFLSPSFFGALSLGGMYVLGMVTPLLLISLFLTDKMTKLTLLRKPLGEVNIFGRSYPIIFSNLIASAIFLITGVLTLTLTLTGKLSMENMKDLTQIIINTGNQANNLTQGSVILQIILILLLGIFLWKVFKKI